MVALLLLLLCVMHVKVQSLRSFSHTTGEGEIAPELGVRVRARWVHYTTAAAELSVFVSCVCVFDDDGQQQDR